MVVDQVQWGFRFGAGDDDAGVTVGGGPFDRQAEQLEGSVGTIPKPKCGTPAVVSRYQREVPTKQSNRARVLIPGTHERGFACRPVRAWQRRLVKQ